MYIMEKYGVFILTTLFASISTQARVSKVYRTDYEYNPRTDSFYKFHTESRRGFKSSEVCEIEGAKLLKIESSEDVQQTHGMFKRYPDLAMYAWVQRDGLAHEPAEEQPLIQLSEEVEAPLPLRCDVINRRGEIETFLCFEELPFFCKVKAADAPINQRCGTYGKNYEYKASTGSCYKVTGNAYSWNEAFAECRAEGAHLLVLNSEAESHTVQNMTRDIRVVVSHMPWFFLAGYRAHRPVGTEPVVFKTIFNQTLEEAGFSEWSPNEPNNWSGNEYCGSIFCGNGKLNDVNCNEEHAFVCEKEVHQ